MIEFRPIASSSSGCCYHLTGGGARGGLLIDAGLRFEQIRIALNFRVSGLAGCILSHGHGDHVKGVPELQKAGVDCYASPETWANWRWGKLAEHRCKELRLKETTKVGDWTVLPFDAVHDEPGTYGFLVGSPDGFNLLYLSDSAYSRYTFENVHILAVECNHSEEIIRRNASDGSINRERYARTFKTHMSIERLEQMLVANDLSSVEEIHLLHLSSENSDEADFKARIQRLTGKPVYVAAS